jgi:hypothetical protein
MPIPCEPRAAWRLDQRRRLQRTGAMDGRLSTARFGERNKLRQSRRRAHEHVHRPAGIESRFADPTKRRSSPQWADLFKKKAEGRCFRCLASDHRVAHCRDRLRCILCFEVGHHARHCRSSHCAPAAASPHRHPICAASPADADHSHLLRSHGVPPLCSSRPWSPWLPV